jgi:hypothetical protein
LGQKINSSVAPVTDVSARLEVDTARDYDSILAAHRQFETRVRVHPSRFADSGRINIVTSNWLS